MKIISIIISVLALLGTNVSGLYHVKVSRDLDRIGKLRYQVYATSKLERPETFSYVEQHTNHEAKTFIEPLDGKGIHVVAESKVTGEFIGCVRLNIGQDGLGNEETAMFGIQSSDIEHSMMCSGLCVLPQQRNSFVTAQLLKMVHQYVSNEHKNIRWLYITAPKDLLGLYGKLGFVPIHVTKHAYFGNVSCLKFDFNNELTDSMKKLGFCKVDSTSSGPFKQTKRTLGLPKFRTSQIALKATLSADEATITEDFNLLIKDAFIEAMNTFNNSNTMRLLAEGNLTIDQYKSILREVYYYVREDPQIEAVFTAYLRGSARHVVKPLLRHAISEVGHEQLALNDLMALGENVDELPYLRPLPTTMGLIAFAFFQMNYRNPIGHLGYLYFLEFLPTSAGGSLLAALKKGGIPDKATTFLQEHVEADEGHNKLMVHFIADLVKTKEDCNAVIHAILTTSALYVTLLDGAIMDTRMDTRIPDGMEV